MKIPTRLLLYCFAITIILSSCKIRQEIKHYPDFTGYTEIDPEVTKHHDSLFSYQDNYLIKNEYNQWEMYLKGDALERGIIAGALLDSLSQYQEQVFVSKIDDFVPSEKKQMRLLGFLGWYNRKIHKYIPNEYQVELYGLAKYMSPKYDYIGPAYLRNLYYHAAHDIGHALVDFSMVECTSAALWGGRSEDGKMIIGRNMDFYLSDDFAKNKLILFIEPDEGIPYVSITWPGMMGVVSGMNYEGLTVTMNAGKSSFPLTAKQPISILARDILEHASTIEEAVAIASKSEVFVAEALMIGSAKDGKTAIIEITPKKFGVYEISGEELICSNHFQSDVYKKDKKNQERIDTEHSLYRYIRMQELLAEAGSLNPEKMVDILRDRKGIDDKEIGYGNEKALNQLLCHHGVVFKPEDKLIWVSSSPYNLGAFTAYDLNDIFGENRKRDLTTQHIEALTIEKDPFQYTKDFSKYEQYRVVDKEINKLIENEEEVENYDFVEAYLALNPELWEVHYKAGLIYYNNEDYTLAKNSFETALQKEVTNLGDCHAVNKILKKTEKKLKKKKK